METAYGGTYIITNFIHLTFGFDQGSPFLINGADELLVLDRLEVLSIFLTLHSSITCAASPIHIVWFHQRELPGWTRHGSIEVMFLYQGHLPVC